MNIRLWIGLGMLATATLLNACQSGQTPQSTLSEEERQALIEEKEKNDPVLRSQKDVGLSAEITREGRIQVVVTNKTSMPIVVGPKLFAFINTRTKAVDPVTAESFRYFPVTSIKPGNSASGQLLPPPGGWGLRHTRLVLSHPELEPAMARITR